MKKIFFILLFSPLISFGQFVTPQGTQAVTTGSSVSVNAGVGILNINPSSALASLTVTFPSTPNDRDIMVIQFGGTMTSGTVVTILTVTAAAGIMGVTPVTAASGVTMMWVYNAVIGKWYRLF